MVTLLMSFVLAVLGYVGCRSRIVALEQSGEDRRMNRHQLDPSPLTTVDVFSRDLRPALPVNPGDTIVLRQSHPCTSSPRERRMKHVR
jgi:hypothetical protein